MRILSPFFCLAVIAAWASDGATQAASTWDHNGSQVSLSATGARRQFHYQAPMASLLGLGVQPGTLLFDGRRNGNQYSGTAYVFSKVCGARAYAVAGPVSPDERTVTMYGKAPIVDSNCRVAKYRDDVLVFNFILPVGAPANQNHAEQTTLQPTQQRAPGQQAYAIEYDRFIQQLMSCFETASIDVSIKACGAALSFPRLIEDDRTKLLQRRADLAREWQQLTAQKPIGVLQRNPDNASASAPNSRNASASREGNVERTSFISTHFGSLVTLGGVIVLFAITGVVWLWQRNSPSSVVAMQNPADGGGRAGSEATRSGTW
jgi:hypothetical protein